MQLLKPSWVTHDEKPIFSVDIHPKGGRFATGGQGGDSGRVVVWNLEPVLSEKAELDSAVPKMLCQMDNHLACVNIVRWSCEGHLLASGGDDKLVMIWKLTGEGNSAVFGGGGKVNVETWKCVATLNSHTGDVLDLAWAQHDGWLASCSVDNTVIVWNARKFPDKIAVLKGHTGLVKGVTWDPVGKYLASQSDDRTVRVWRTADWGQQMLITEPFEECSGTTHVLRLSWSPDGQYLVSAHAMNGGGPTAQIIEREGWKQDKDFVGHRKAVTCVRFNSNILQRSFPGSPKTQQYCCCAIGARDRSLSVWLTSLKRPLVVIHDLFTSSVLDLSWSSSGLHLIACSWDGTVACIEFTPEEIGKPLSTSDKNALYERMYGKSFQKNWTQSFSNTQIVENPEMLNIMEELSTKEPVPTNSTPTVVPTTPVARRDPIKPTTVTTPTNKQIEVRLPDGKRRITPMFITSSASESNKDSLGVPPKPEALSSSSPAKSKIIVEKVREIPSVNVFHPTPVKTSVKVPERRAITHSFVTKIPGIQLGAVSSRDIPGEEPVVHFISPLDPLRAAGGVTITKVCHRTKIQITNECHTITHGSLARLQVFKTVSAEQPMWETYLGSAVRCVAANRKIMIACCQDMSLNCYKITTGARSLPPLLLEDSVVSLCLSEKSLCLVLTATGLLHLWDFDSSKSVLSRVSIRSLLHSIVSVSTCVLTTSDLPLITLSDGRAYIYNLGLCTWVLLSNPLDPLNRVGSGLIVCAPESLPLSSLQKTSSIANNIVDSLPSGVTLSFLENQLAACTALQSPIEFKHWLLATVEHLLEKGPECRLRSILDDLMGPTYKSATKEKEQTILGLSKRALLNDSLALIGNRLPWQRLYKEYMEQIAQSKSGS
ncbi:hira [Carabus blaptoides fortunei]